MSRASERGPARAVRCHCFVTSVLDPIFAFFGLPLLSEGGNDPVPFFSSWGLLFFLESRFGNPASGPAECSVAWAASPAAENVVAEGARHVAIRAGAEEPARPEVSATSLGHLGSSFEH